LVFLTFSVFFSPVRAIYGDVRENDKLTATLFDDTTPFLILERSKKEMTPKIGFRDFGFRVEIRKGTAVDWFLSEFSLELFSS
jgi:hypothetical protein